MKKREAMIALRDAQLKKGHLLNTRKAYRHWLCRYIDGAASGRFSDLQESLDHLVNQLPAIIPFAPTRHQATA